NDLGDLDDIAGGELLKVGLVTTGPVGGLFGEGGAEHLEHLVEPLLADDVTHADQVDIVCRHLDRQVTLGDIELEVEFLLALDDALLDLNGGCSTVVRVNDGFADLEEHGYSSIP